MFGKKRRDNSAGSVENRNETTAPNVDVNIGQTVDPRAQQFSNQNTFYPNMQQYPQGMYAAPYNIGFGVPQAPVAQPRQNGAAFCNFNPTSYTDVAPILEKIKSRAVVLVNISKMPRDERVRIMDMISGAIYVLGGNIETIQDNMFSVTPPGAGK